MNNFPTKTLKLSTASGLRKSVKHAYVKDPTDEINSNVEHSITN